MGRNMMEKPNKETKAQSEKEEYIKQLRGNKKRKSNEKKKRRERKK